MGSILTLTKNFSKEVEAVVRKQREVSYMTAVIDLCEKYDIDPGAVNKLLTKPIKNKIQEEGEQLNLLPKQDRLPLD